MGHGYGAQFKRYILFIGICIPLSIQIRVIYLLRYINNLGIEMGKG
jgi:hypothetical protein